MRNERPNPKLALSGNWFVETLMVAAQTRKQQPLLRKGQTLSRAEATFDRQRTQWCEPASKFHYRKMVATPLLQPIQPQQLLPKTLALMMVVNAGKSNRHLLHLTRTQKYQGQDHKRKQMDLQAQVRIVRWTLSENPLS
jgi:hypothetical protein